MPCDSNGWSLLQVPQDWEVYIVLSGEVSVVLSESRLSAVQKLGFQSWLSLTSSGQSFHFSGLFPGEGKNPYQLFKRRFKDMSNDRVRHKAPSWSLRLFQDFGDRTYFVLKGTYSSVECKTKMNFKMKFKIVLAEFEEH